MVVEIYRSDKPFKVMDDETKRPMTAKIRLEWDDHRHYFTVKLDVLNIRFIDGLEVHRWETEDTLFCLEEPSFLMSSRWSDTGVEICRLIELVETSYQTVADIKCFFSNNYFC